MIQRMLIKESPGGLTKLFWLKGGVDAFYVQYNETALPVLFSLRKAELLYDLICGNDMPPEKEKE